MMQLPARLDSDISYDVFDGRGFRAEQHINLVISVTVRLLNPGGQLVNSTKIQKNPKT
jgi:hypothetical protein